MRKQQLTISKQISTCYEYVDKAEVASHKGSFADSDRFWQSAASIALSLLSANDPGTFLDEEYTFLTQISKYFKDEDDTTEHY